MPLGGKCTLFFYFMKRFLLLVLAAVLAVTACQKKEKVAEPSVFRVSPKSAMNESGFAHELQIMVTCDVQFSHTLDDGSWIEISSSGRNASNLTTLSLMLSMNDSPSERRETLHIQAGSQKTEVEIVQKPLSKAVSVNEVRLQYVFPESLTFNFPEDWTLSSDDSWIRLGTTSGKAGKRTQVEIRSAEMNLTDRARTGQIKIAFQDGAVFLPVIQESSLPSGSFAESVYGIYNYNGIGASITYEPLSAQTNIARHSSGNIFRIVDPMEGKFIEIGGLSSSTAVSDSTRLVIYQNWTDDLAFRSEKDAWVLKAENGFVWLIDPDKTGYIIKN